MPAPSDRLMKPAVFCNRSVRAWQQNAKTQTRRLVNPQPMNARWYLRQQKCDGRWAWWTRLQDGRGCWAASVRQPYAVGDLLWIREALKRGRFGYVLYATHPFDYLREEDSETGWRWPWKRDKLPGMFMPRWACRFYARVVSLRPERLRDISYDDAVAEGTLIGMDFCSVPVWHDGTVQSLYFEWWADLHKKSGTRSEDNPWVWVYGLEAADASTKA